MIQGCSGLAVDTCDPLLWLLAVVVLFCGVLPCSNRIQVSSSKKPMFFYVNLAKASLLALCRPAGLCRYLPEAPAHMVAVVPCSCPLQRLLGEHDEVHLSALGMAVSTMVSIVEILKKDGLAVESREFGGDTQRTPPESLRASRPGPACRRQLTTNHSPPWRRPPAASRAAAPQPHAATHHVACCRSAAPLPACHRSVNHHGDPWRGQAAASAESKDGDCVA